MHLSSPILMIWRAKKASCTSTKFFTKSTMRSERTENCHKSLHSCETVLPKQHPRLRPVLPTEDTLCVREQEVSSSETQK